MLPRFNGKQIFKTIVRNRSSKSISPDQWHLFAAICLQRCPIIVPELNWFEKQMQKFLNRLEFNNSLYSDHEMKHFEDLRRTERIASGTDVDEKDLEEASKQTAKDFEEASLEELKQFELSSSITKADLCNNNKSIDRSLEKHLYLSVKNNLGENEYWMFPDEQFQPEVDKSLRCTAERALGKCFSLNKGMPGAYVKFLGNLPSAVYNYRYPKTVSSKLGKYGRRIFLFKCQLDINMANQPSEGEFGTRIMKIMNYSDYSWLTRDELQHQMPKLYWKIFGSSIYPDELINVEQLIARNKTASKIKQRLEKLEAKIN